jgi:hypothetical protein
MEPSQVCEVRRLNSQFPQQRQALKNTRGQTCQYVVVDSPEQAQEKVRLLFIPAWDRYDLSKKCQKRTKLTAL